MIVSGNERRSAAPSGSARDASGESTIIEHKHVAVSRSLVMINAASAVLARLLNIFVLIWLYAYLLERVSPEEFALYPLVMTVMVFAPFFFSFFIGGVSRYIVSAYALNERQRVVEIVSSITPLIIALVFAFILLGALLLMTVEYVFVIPEGMVDVTRLMLGLLIGSFAVQMVLMPFGVGFHVRQRFVELNVLWLLRDAMRLVLMFSLLHGVGPAVLWVVVATVAADLLHVFVVTIRSRMLVRELVWRASAFRWDTARTLLSFGAWTTLGRLAGILYVNAGVIVLNRFGTAVDVANYFFAAALFHQIRGMIAFARQPLQPSLIAVHSLADRARLARAANSGGAYGLWVSLIVAAPLAVFAPDIVERVMGPEYSQAALVVMLFMAIFPFSQPAGILPMIAVATGEVRAFNVAALASTLAGFMLMVFAAAVLNVGAVGVTASLLIITAITQLAYFCPLNLRLSGLSLHEFMNGVVVRGLAPAAVALPLWVVGASLVDPNDWLMLALAAVPGGVAYLLAMMLCFDEADRSIVRELYLRAFGRSQLRPAR